MWQYSPYLVPLCGAVLVAVVLGAIGWRRRLAPGAYTFVGLTAALAIWSAGYAAELSSASLPLAVVWAKLQYLGIVTVPVLWLIFILQYTDSRVKLTRRRVAGLFALPAATLAMTWTNELHGLIWSALRWDTTSGIGYFDVDHGAWFWLHTAYSYVVILLGTIVLVRTLLLAPQLYRGQAVGLLIGASAPWIANALYLSGASPWPHLDLTPFAFTATGIAFGRSFLRFRLLAIVPIARDAVVDSMSDSVIALDIFDRIVDVNPAAVRASGQPLAALIGLAAEQAFQVWPAILRRHQPTDDVVEEVVLGAGPEQQTFELRISPLRDRASHVVGRLVVWRDISERKRIEMAARRRAQELELIDQVRVALESAATLPELFRAVVERVAATFGYSLVGIYMVRGDQLHLQYEVGYPNPIDVMPISRGVMGRAVRSGEPVLLSDVRGDPDFVEAAPGVASEVCVPLFDQDRVVGTMNVETTGGVRLGEDDLRLMQLLGQSISTAIERTRLYEELTLSEQRFRTLVANVPGAIYRRTDDELWAEEFISDAITSITGYPASDFIGHPVRSFASITHPADRERVRFEAAGHDVYALEYRIIHADGGVRWVRDLGQRVSGAGGAGWLDGVIFDITARKRDEEALAEARDAAEAASRAKSTFLANMSHELRTPLTAIMGYSQLLEMESRAHGYEALLPDLGSIRTAGSHLLALISDVLDFSKIEAGKLSVTPERFDVELLVTEVAKTVQPLVENRGNTLEVCAGDDLGDMLTDRTKVQQVLLNLLGNAAKFTERGTIALRVSRGAGPGGEDSLRFEIQDTGIGIAPEQVGLLFQPFTQVNSTITRSHGGTGLGLALSRRLARIMGGDITVASEPGVGSTFSVWLPAVASEAAVTDVGET